MSHMASSPVCKGKRGRLLVIHQWFPPLLNWEWVTKISPDPSSTLMREPQVPQQAGLTGLLICTPSQSPRGLPMLDAPLLQKES